MECPWTLVYRGIGNYGGDNNMLKRQWLAASVVFAAFSQLSRYARDIFEIINPQVAIAWHTVSIISIVFMCVCMVLLIMEKEGW